ncbi:MAG: hypothetical protein GY804_01865 [Alphaproteobacteria bacterium]|nr:hypothetical protein [Alphaproteobacteria bacterium]
MTLLHLHIQQEKTGRQMAVPMKIKKRGGAAIVILPKGAQQNNYDQKLISAFAKAYKWQQMLKKDSSLNIRTIAEKENVNTHYVGRMLRLNLVAPDIIKAIVEGKQPRSLKLQDFMTKPVAGTTRAVGVLKDKMS